jgi:hypothetical protein
LLIHFYDELKRIYRQIIIIIYIYINFIMDSKIVMYKQWFIDSHVGNIKDVYHFEERVGSGGFGVVYLATHKKSGMSIYAF